MGNMRENDRHGYPYKIEAKQAIEIHPRME